MNSLLRYLDWNAAHNKHTLGFVNAVNKVLINRWVYRFVSLFVFYWNVNVRLNCRWKARQLWYNKPDVFKWIASFPFSQFPLLRVWWNKTVFFSQFLLLCVWWNKNLYNCSLFSDLYSKVSDSVHSTPDQRNERDIKWTNFQHNKLESISQGWMNRVYFMVEWLISNDLAGKQGFRIYWSFIINSRSPTLSMKIYVLFHYQNVSILLHFKPL